MITIKDAIGKKHIKYNICFVAQGEKLPPAAEYRVDTPIEKINNKSTKKFLFTSKILENKNKSFII